MPASSKSMPRKTSNLALLAGALALQWLIRLALWGLPYPMWRRLVAAGAPSPAPLRASRFSPPQVAWAVAAASRMVPQSTCLVKAVAARLLLSWCGYPSQMQIGVARTPGFQSHAWLECNGEVLVGGFPPGTYTSLAAGAGR
jgi:hypothetical protein